MSNTDSPTNAGAGVAEFVQDSRETNGAGEIGKLVEALAKAQTEFKPILKDTQNSFFKNKYADLGTIIAATQPALAKNGLVVMQMTRMQEHYAGVTTILAHCSGQTISTDLMLPAAQGSKFDCQTVGSALTYARRYAMQAILGVAADADEDGNLAAGNNGSKAAAADVAKAKLQEASQSNDPKTAAIAKEGLAKINAADTAKDLEGQLQRTLEQQKDDGLFDSYSGVIQGVRQLATSAAKGSRPYRKVAMTIFENGQPKDIEFSAFDNFKMSDTTCFNALDAAQPNDSACFILEQAGKYLNLKDIKQIASSHWDARMGVIQRA